MSVAKCQEEVSSTEFQDWQVYLEEEVNHFDKTCYYLAAVAAELRMCRGFKATPEQMMYRFEKQREEPPKAVDPELKTKFSKIRWFGITGLLGRKGKQDVGDNGT